VGEHDYNTGLAIARNNYRMYAGLRSRQYNYYIEKTSPAEGQKEAFEAVQNFTDGFIDGDKPIGLLLVGGVGSGKTFMVSSVANSIIDDMKISEDEAENAVEKTAVKGYSFWCARSKIPVHFISAIELMNQLKACFNNSDSDDISHKIIETLQRVGLLILDDLGAEKASDWTSEKLFEIIDYRYNEGLPLLVTTNCVPGELKKQIGDRNFDRLREMCALVAVTAKSQRPTAILKEKEKDNG